MTVFGIRATFLDFIEDPWRHVGRETEAARFHADGLLVVEDGRITDFGAHDEVATRHAGLAVTTIGNRLVIPGFITPRTLEQAADLLFGVMAVGDDRAIEQTWAMGTQVYLRR